jgi:polysaccharide pyruvyl transferase WcaK-like protein
MTTRREWLTAGALTFAAVSARGASGDKRRPRILLRSSWQSVNIGDVGHTPGALSLLNKHFPEAEITLWPGRLGHGSREMLTRAYPALQIVEGTVSADGRPSRELAQVWAASDLYLSGSGSGFPASGHAVAFHKATGKPVGVFGVSTDPISGIGPSREAEGGTLQELRAKALRLPPDHLPADLRYIIDRAAFFFCRDTISRDYLASQKVKTPILEFGPDAQLGMHIRDDEKGLRYLKESGLEEGRFLCVIPRLRYTPYYRVNNTSRTPADDIKDSINQRTTEKDHAKLREMIVAYVKKTGNRVLACSEMTYQIDLAKQSLVDPLPAEIRKNVVWRDTFWLPDEAASVYARAQAVVSIECHSPLIALHNGTPAMYVRQPTDTCKGQMYRDFGAERWMFEVDETTGEELWSRVSEVAADPARARARVRSIMAEVESRQKRMVAAVRAACQAG